MHGHVLVAFLESVVLFDVVQVISPDNHGPEKLNNKYWQIFKIVKKTVYTFFERGRKLFIFGSIRKKRGPLKKWTFQIGIFCFGGYNKPPILFQKLI